MLVSQQISGKHPAPTTQMNKGKRVISINPLKTITHYMITLPPNEQNPTNSIRKPSWLVWQLELNGSNNNKFEV